MNVKNVLIKFYFNWNSFVW